MAVRKVLRYPHPGLKRRCEPIDPGDVATARSVARDLLETMRSYPGCVGLAAPQIGAQLRVIAVDVTDHPKAERSNGELVLVNPAITSAGRTEVGREGCLSIPDLTANVRRAVDIALEARTPAGDPVTLSSTGFEARCLAHEIDHLDGILFLDRVDSLATDVFRRKRYR